MSDFLSSSFLLLGLFVFLAGFVDSIAGGGGLITLPAYIHYGLKLDFLLGTNKMSSTLGTSVAAVKYLRELRFKSGYLVPVVITAAMGSVLGAKLISVLPPITVKYLLIAVIPPTAFLLVSRKDWGLRDMSSAYPEKVLILRSLLISFSISFYDGMLGPGTGTFFAIALAGFCKYDILRATALSKLLNLTSNVSALVAFLILGKVNLLLGISMGFIGMAGNYAGAHLALKKGVWIIKPLLFIVSNGLLAKIIWDMLK
ncbi:MAG: TSUP family transporter [Elusimicrobia bacterium]|nr:TSUP family transporter [Elusimicrobiota bacterium]